MLLAIALCVSEELVVLITPSFCLRLTAKDHEDFQTSALKMKNEGVDKSFMTADVSSLMLTILLYKSAILKVQLMQNLAIVEKFVKKTLRQLAGNQSQIHGKSAFFLALINARFYLNILK